MSKVNFWVSTDGEGNIIAGSSVDPTMNLQEVIESEVENVHHFELTWEQIENIWKYKVTDNDLVLKEVK